MNKQTYRNRFVAITAFALVLLGNPVANAVAQDEAGIVLENFTVDIGSVEPGLRAGGGGEPRNCRIAISAESGKPFMVCEGVNAVGNAVSCFSDEPPFTGALLGMTDFEKVIADQGHAAGRCTKL